MGSRRCCKSAREILRLCGVCELERRVSSNIYAEDEYLRSGKGIEGSKTLGRLLRLRRVGTRNVGRVIAIVMLQDLGAEEDAGNMVTSRHHGMGETSKCFRARPSTVLPKETSG